MQEFLFKLVDAFWVMTLELGPYMILGLLIAGILHVVLPVDFIRKHLGGKGLAPSFKASMFGIPLPICSCGVLPFIATLRRNGAGRGATTSFLISTPQTGVDSILATYAMLGPVIAIFRPIAAFITGMAGGLLADTQYDDEADAVALKNSTPKPPAQQLGFIEKTKQALYYGFIEIPKDLAGPLLIGLLLAAILTASLPNGFLANMPGGMAAQFGLMLLFSIPLYVCATASVPIAASIIGLGISPGAALVFLVAGPATNIATIGTIWKLLGLRNTVVYVGTVIAGAILGGALLNGILVSTNWQAQINMAGHLGPYWLSFATAILTLLVMAWALIQQFLPGNGHSHGHAAEAEEGALVLAVEGMDCNHCVASVTDSLSRQAGVESVDVSLQNGTATIRGEGFSLETLKEAVRSVGYGVKDDSQP